MLIRSSAIYSQILTSPLRHWEAAMRLTGTVSLNSIDEQFAILCRECLEAMINDFEKSCFTFRLYWKNAQIKRFSRGPGCEKAIEYIIYEAVRGDLLDKTFIQIDLEWRRLIPSVVIRGAGAKIITMFIYTRIDKKVSQPTTRYASIVDKSIRK